MTEDHSKRAHALLSCSGSSRWLNCTPSPRLEDQFEDQSSVYADEGTLAHEFGEVGLRNGLKHYTTSEYRKRLRELRSHKLYFDGMESEVQKYTVYVWDEFTMAKKVTPDAELIVEQKVDLTKYIENGFGLNDATIIGDGILNVFDLKFGQGIRVDADDNSQLMLYGLGSLLANEFFYDIHRVRLHIIQPRLDHISVWEISADELKRWGEGTVKPKAELAYAGKGELCAGDWCRWCKVKPRCRALAEKNQEIAKHDFADPKLLNDEEILDIHLRLPALQDWARGVNSYLMTEALNGKEWPGYKIVAGRSNRRWSDEMKASEILQEKGFTTQQIMNHKIKGIGDIEKLVTKKQFPLLLKDCVIKPEGKPSFVPDSDPRKPISINSAKEDFKD